MNVYERHQCCSDSEGFYEERSPELQYGLKIYIKRLMIMSDTTLYNSLKEFIECEGKSCSFDPELITPEYVFRMWGGQVPLEEIEEAMNLIKQLL